MKDIFKMDYIVAQVMIYVDNEEKQIARLNLYCKPNIGEHLWIHQGQGKQEAFIIEDICHWVSNTMQFEHGHNMTKIPYQTLAIYVKKL